MTTHAIRWLGHDECHDDEIVGGKAASLSRLAAMHEIPAGFAVPAVSPLAKAIHPDLAGAIELAYRALGARRDHSDLPVAVRSSAVDEDGVDSSFAGQHDTYLNVRGADAVLDAVHRCIRSAASDEAVAYRTQRGLAIEEVRIAVLIQELVPSDVSAVAFSANPVTGCRDEVMINANWGLGESIVGGTATPDTFVVLKEGWEIALRDIAQKERMTVMAELGTRDVDVPPELQSRSSLDDEQIVRITRLAMMLEDAEGWPVDIECAIARDVLYLLQCRPITTLR